MKTLHLLALLAFLLSCSKVEKQPNPVLDCIGTKSVSFVPFGCEDQGPIDYLCRFDNVGNISIEDSSKVYMPQFCKDKGDLLIFQNAAGDKTTFELTAKSYSGLTVTYNTAIQCPEDSTKTIGYCIDSEIIQLRLKAIDKDLEIWLELTSIPDIDASGFGKVRDVLKISRWKTANSYTIDFYAVIDQRTSSIAHTDNQQFFENITLLGKNYTDVVSNDMTNYINAYTYYVSKQRGLIAFADLDGTLWKIMD